MKATLVLAVLAAAALQALAAPAPQQLDEEGPLPSSEDSSTRDRERKSNYGPVHAPCAASHLNLGGGYGSGLDGYGGGFGGYGGGAHQLAHAGFSGPLLPHAQLSLGGYGAGLGGGYGPQVSYGLGGHYREAEQEAEAAASEMNNQFVQNQQDSVNRQQHQETLKMIQQDQPPLEPSARAYEAGYGGSGLSLGGGFSPALLGPSPLVQKSLGLGHGGPSVGVFPGSLGGCGAIPLLLSCSPNLVSGHLVQLPHKHTAPFVSGAGGFGYPGAALGGHGLYRSQPALPPWLLKSAEEERKPEQASSQASEQQSSHAAPAPAPAQPSVAGAHTASTTHSKSSSQSHTQQQSSSVHSQTQHSAAARRA